MPLHLITASNGHGKGQFAIKTILEIEKENDKLEKEGKPRRIIYTNIHGINEAGRPPLKDCQPLPSEYIFFGKQNDPEHPPPEGYFLPPIGSIFMFDEAQEFDWIKQKSGALSNDIRVTSLEKHRHSGLDIYFITQSPNYIHSHIFNLCAPHIYLERPLGLETTNVFVFNKAQKSPESVTVKAKADDHYMMSLGEKYGKYYESSAQHNIKKIIPFKLKVLVGVLVVCVVYTIYNFSQTRFVKKDEVAQEQIEQTTTVTSTVPLPEPTPLRQHLPIIVADTAYNEDIRPAMIIASSESCTAYNSYGERLRITDADCMMMSDDPSYIPRTRQQTAVQTVSDETQLSPSDTTTINPIT